MPVDRPHQFPYLWCNHDDSSHTIWLPHSSLLGRFPDRPERANNTYFEIYACPTCGLVCEYRSLNVLWRPRQNADPNSKPEPYVAVIEFQCGAENCDTLVTIHKPSRELLTVKAILEESAGWLLSGVHCNKGHVILGLPANRTAYLKDPRGAHLELS